MPGCLTIVRKNANIIKEEQRVSKTNVVFYQENDGTVPALEWLDHLGDKARAKVLVRIERLKQLGSQLRRPEADYLRDGIYELRVSLQGIHHRLLYFFCGRAVAVLSHGLVKERTVPSREIELAIRRKNRFEADPKAHSYAED
jgi:phage-related protein